MISASMLTLLFAVLSASSADAGTESDAKNLEGVWKPKSAEIAGQPWPQKLLDSTKLTLKGDTYEVDVSGQLDQGTCAHDPGKSPKTLDITGTKGPNKGKTFLAIYELKGDDLKVCYDLSGKSRPSEFATKAGTALFFVHYRRAKP
jgi:uncharacterized protein (TIGR03067 family)